MGYTGALQWAKRGPYMGYSGPLQGATWGPDLQLRHELLGHFGVLVGSGDGGLGAGRGPPSPGRVPGPPEGGGGAAAHLDHVGALHHRAHTRHGVRGQ